MNRREGINMNKRTWSAIIAGLIAIVLAACGDGGSKSPEPTASVAPSESPTAAVSSGLPQGGEPFDLDPASFVAEIDNPYWPMSPGSRWVYTETDADGNELQVEVTVTSETKVIAGITATVVHDTVTENGSVIEDTFDWYAQDADGNIWYLGEDTKEYENGEVVSTAGSWEHGVDGALAGVAVPADPAIGMAYRQEYYAGEAEDMGKVLALDATADVPFGSFDGCLQTEDTTPLEPDVLEHKYYCRGVGPVLAIDAGGGGGREELTTFEAGA
jgi:hypothetical protein